MGRAQGAEPGHGSLRAVGIPPPQDVLLDIRVSSDGPSDCKHGLTLPLNEWPGGCEFPRLLEYSGVTGSSADPLGLTVGFCSVPAHARMDDDSLICIPWKI